MNDATIVTPCMAALLVELTQRVQEEAEEAAAARVDAAEVREQRSMLLLQLHERDKDAKRQQSRIVALCDENRRLRAQVAEWQQVAA